MRQLVRHLGDTVACFGLVTAIVADCAAALAIFNYQVAWGLIVHGVASLLWLAARQQTVNAPAKRGSLARLLESESGSQWCIILCLFPALGMVCEAIAVLADGLFALPTHAERAVDSKDDSMSDILGLVRRELLRPFDPSLEATALPLAALLTTATIVEKRAAIDLICHCPHPRGMALARQLLSDADPDIRALAAMAIDRLGQYRAQEALDS